MELPYPKATYSAISPAQPEGHGHIAQVRTVSREHLVVAGFGKHFHPSAQPEIKTAPGIESAFVGASSTRRPRGEFTNWYTGQGSRHRLHGDITRKRSEESFQIPLVTV